MTKVQESLGQGEVVKRHPYLPTSLLKGKMQRVSERRLRRMQSPQPQAGETRNTDLSYVIGERLKASFIYRSWKSSKTFKAIDINNARTVEECLQVKRRKTLFSLSKQLIFTPLNIQIQPSCQQGRNKNIDKMADLVTWSSHDLEAVGI